MEAILSRCGYRCDLCLAYKPNVDSNPANRQKLSDGWYRYFGFRLPAEEIVCDGCMTANPKLIDRSCPVRPCVIENGLENCSFCEQYICEKLAERIVVYEAVKQRINIEIPDGDHIFFILPYENKKRLDELRISRQGGRKQEDRQCALY